MHANNLFYNIDQFLIYKCSMLHYTITQLLPFCSPKTTILYALSSYAHIKYNNTSTKYTHSHPSNLGITFHLLCLINSLPFCQCSMCGLKILFCQQLLSFTLLFLCIFSILRTLLPYYILLFERCCRIEYLTN